MNWSEAYEHVGNSIAVPVKLIHAIGAKGAVFIAQLFFWKGKQNDPDGWIYKTKMALEEETGLARWEQETCVKDLKEKGILETRYERLDHRLYYRINTARLDAIMGRAVTPKKGVSPSEIGNPDLGKQATSPGQIWKPDFGKPEIAISPKRESSLPEPTVPDFVYIEQEITTESTYKRDPQPAAPIPVPTLVPELVLEFSEPKKPKRNKARAKDFEELSAYILGELDLSENDACWLWEKWEGNGWKNAGKAIADWRLTASSWERMGYFPSQKTGHRQ